MGLRDDPQMQAKYLKYLGYLMTVGGGVITVAFPSILTGIMGYLMVINEGGLITPLWEAPPIGVPIKTYVFSVENPDEFMLGQKAKLKQMGPYVFE